MNYLKFLFYIFLSSFVLIGLPSYAQDSAIETKIKELENQIQDLKIQMKILNKKNNTSVENELKFKIGPGFSVKHGENSFKIHGRMHYDWGFLPDIDGDDELGSGTNIRRARIGLKGTAGKFFYTATFDMGASAKADESDDVANIDEMFFGWKANKTTDLAVGKLKIPMFFEEATSSNDLSFLERSLAVDAFSDTFLGPKRHAVRFQHYDKKIGYKIAAAYAFDGDKKDKNVDQSRTISARAAYAPILSKTEALHLGAWTSYHDFGANQNGATQGCEWEYRFEINISDDKPLDSGNVTACDNVRTSGLELAYLGMNGQFWGMSEYVFGKMERTEDTSSNTAYNDYDANGYYWAVGYVLNGKKRYSIKKASFQAPKVETKWPEKGNGVWEVAFRQTRVSLNDEEADINGGMVQNRTLALNWYVNGNATIKLNYINSKLDDAAVTNAGATEDGGKNGDTINIIGGRFQYKW